MLSQNALMSQSWSDRRGESNLDGWGIACYKGDHPWLKKSGAPAYRDELFRKTVERIYTRTVVAHVRHATVGRYSIHNAHPFVNDRWTFAHNGTLYGFKLLEPRLLEEVDEDLRPLRRGETDSELMFLWLLTRIRHLANSAAGARPPFWDMMELLAVALRELDMRSSATGVDLDSQLNFILTDGHVLFATRFRNDMFMQSENEPHHCDACGRDHMQGNAPPGLRCVTIASEPINDRSWEALPAMSVTGVDENLDMHCWPA